MENRSQVRACNRLSDHGATAKAAVRLKRALHPSLGFDHKNGSAMFDGMLAEFGLLLELGQSRMGLYEKELLQKLVYTHGICTGKKVILNDGSQLSFVPVSATELWDRYCHARYCMCDVNAGSGIMGAWLAAALFPGAGADPSGRPHPCIRDIFLASTLLQYEDALGKGMGCSYEANPALYFFFTAKQLSEFLMSHKELKCSRSPKEGLVLHSRNHRSVKSIEPFIDEELACMGLYGINTGACEMKLLIRRV